MPSQTLTDLQTMSPGAPFANHDVIACIAARVASVRDLWALTATCRIARACRSDAYVISRYLLRTYPAWKALFVAIDRIHDAALALEVVRHLVPAVLAECGTLDVCNVAYVAVYYHRYLISRNKSGRTALHEAARNGRDKIVEYLVQRGAGVDQGTASSETPLMLAAANRHLAAVQALLSHGADVCKRRVPQDYSVLMLACAVRDNESVVSALLAAGADPNDVRDVEGDEGYQGIEGDDISALMMAASRGSVGMVDALIAAGADVNYLSNARMTALVYAIDYGEDDSIRALLAAGAEVHHVCIFTNWNAYEYAKKGVSGVPADIIKALRARLREYE